MTGFQLFTAEAATGREDRTTVEVHSSLAALSTSDWSRLAASRSVFQEWTWYRTAPPPGRLRLLVAYQNKRPIAALPLFVIDSPGHYYHTPRNLFCGFRERALLRASGHPVALLEQAAAAGWFPAAASISPYGYRGGLMIADQSLAAAAAAVLLPAADDLCRREGVRVAVHFYLNEVDDGPWLAALAGHGARTVVVGADCNLEMGWPSLAAYFRAHGSRGRRLRAAHCRTQQSAAVHWRASALDDHDPNPGLTEALIDLFAQTARAHGDSAPPLALYESLLCGWPGRRLLLWGETASGRLRSALLVLVKKGTLYPKLFGAAGAQGDYFFLTYSWLIELAIAAGMRRIEYGGGSHQAKLLRGARLRWLLAAVQVYDPELARPLARLLPHYQSAKVAHFSQLASRYQVDHAPPPPPVLTLA